MSQEVVYTCDRCKMAVAYPCAKVKVELLERLDDGIFGARRTFVAQTERDMCAKCRQALMEFMNGT